MEARRVGRARVTRCGLTQHAGMAVEEVATGSVFALHTGISIEAEAATGDGFALHAGIAVEVVGEDATAATVVVVVVVVVVVGAWVQPIRPPSLGQATWTWSLRAGHAQTQDGFEDQPT